MQNNQHANISLALHQAVQNRILVIDGAMGSLIQGYRLTESQFRGNLIPPNHPVDV